MTEFRVAVEIYIRYHDKFLILRRSSNDATHSNRWSVPSGKAKFTELPEQAAIRECKEETGLEVELITELDRRATTIIKADAEAYRLFFSYLAVPVKPIELDDVTLNHEHSEYAWIDQEQLDDSSYGLFEHSKAIVKEAGFWKNEE